MKFYATFEQNHTYNPRYSLFIDKLEDGMVLKDYWVEVYTDSRMDAHHLMYQHFRYKWGSLYLAHEFDRSYFPKGKLMELGVPTEEDRFDDKLEWIYDQRINNREVEGNGDTVK